MFVSYARDDQGYVNDLIEHLDVHNITSWIDTRIDYGATWTSVIRDRLDACAALIVVMTPRSEASAWVGREVIRAQQQGKTILPMLLEGQPFFEVNTVQHEDVTGGRMPTASCIGRLQHLVSTELPAGSTRAGTPSRGTVALQFWLDEGQRLIEFKDFKAAIAAYERAIQVDRTSSAAHAGLARALGFYGETGAVMKRRCHKRALAAANAALELDPTNGLALRAKGNALWDLGNKQQAVAIFDRSIELDPTDYIAHHNRGNSLRHLGRNDESLISLDRSVELEPTYIRAHQHRGDALRALGRHEEAQAAFERADELRARGVRFI